MKTQIEIEEAHRQERNGTTYPYMKWLENSSPGQCFTLSPTFVKLLSTICFYVDAPICVYVHGGYWQEEAINHRNNVFPTKCLHKNGIKSIFIGYELCPHVTIEEMVRNIEKAVGRCLDYGKTHKTRNVDWLVTTSWSTYGPGNLLFPTRRLWSVRVLDGSGRYECWTVLLDSAWLWLSVGDAAELELGLYLIGHSAGAHLMTMLFTTFIPSLSEEDQLLFKGAFLICGLYDLTPLVKTRANEALELDEDSAREVSPLHRRLSAIGTNFYVIVAQHDSPVFFKQGRQFHDHLLGFGLSSKYVSVENVDHYEIIENLINEEFQLTQIIIQTVTTQA
ncbi:hypothetical protein NQ317_013697 [Molorchus minor]|uniref:Kynurenine formamidase n=1 Tax=Molorchus minor TaxID=1323400 RepID=A0ABQ9JE51_9CUCU|nr:hypothetical protein NQ317_013697 [Molorchus minor]